MRFDYLCASTFLGFTMMLVVFTDYSGFGSNVLE